MDEYSKKRQVIPILCAAFLDYLNVTIALVIFPILMTHETRSILPLDASPATKTLLVVVECLIAGLFD